MNDLYCNNCGKKGHLYNQCKAPITSSGIVAFRIYNNEIQFLMIRRKDTLGFIDFIRGKYSIHNKDYIKNMVLQMTMKERDMLKTMTFQDLWINVWGNNSISSQYKNEENVSREKFNLLKKGIEKRNDFYTIETIINECSSIVWEEQEWGFPKGRRNFQEKDYDCAIREFTEETGINNDYYIILNSKEFIEEYIGTDGKIYKNLDYLAKYINKNIDLHINPSNRHQITEISLLKFFTLEEAISKFRSYHIEKINIIKEADKYILDNELYKFKPYSINKKL